MKGSVRTENTETHQSSVELCWLLGMSVLNEIHAHRPLIFILLSPLESDLVRRWPPAGSAHFICYALSMAGRILLQLRCAISHLARQLYFPPDKG